VEPETDRPDKPNAANPPGDRSAAQATRRAFLGAVGKKALYVTPIVMTLTAQQARAASTPSSCTSTGEACTEDTDCCTTHCNPQDTCVCLDHMVACTEDVECCSESCGVAMAGECDMG